MSEKNEYYSFEKLKSHSQFRNEIFLRYSKYFTKLNVKYGDFNMKNSFYFDSVSETLYIPQNPTFSQMNNIITYLDNIIKYRQGITAKIRLEKEKGKIKRASLKKKNEFENILFIESLYESGKKQVYDTMLAPYSNRLLKDVLDLEKLSRKFNILSLEKQKKVVSNILFVLGKYDIANSKDVKGGLPMIFLKNRELYCVGYSYLADIIFEKLKVKHYVGSGIIINGEKKMPHSISVIKLKNKYFIFDPTSGLDLLEVKVKNNRIDFRNDKESYYSGYIFTLGDPEKEIIAQNLVNLSFGKYNQKKYLNYALKFSPKNIIIKYLLKENK